MGLATRHGAEAGDGVWRQIIGAIAALIFVQMVTQAGQGAVRGNAGHWPLAYAGPLVGFLIGFGLLFLAARPALLKRRRRTPS